MAIEDNRRGAPKRHTCFVRSHIALKFLASLATFAAAIVMALNKQKTVLMGFPIKASVNSSPAFKFLVIGNGIVCAYSLVTLPLTFKFLVASSWISVLDAVMFGLDVSSLAAAAAIAYVGKEGNPKIGWSEVCSYVGKFCDRVTMSLLLTFIGVVLYLVICTISSVYKTKLVTDL